MQLHLQSSCEKWWGQTVEIITWAEAGGEGSSITTIYPRTAILWPALHNGLELREMWFSHWLLTKYFKILEDITQGNFRTPESRMVQVLRYPFPKITSLFLICDSQRKKMILLCSGPSLLHHLFALKGGGGGIVFLPKMLLNSVASFTTISAIVSFLEIIFIFSTWSQQLLITMTVMVTMMMSNIWCTASAQQANFCVGREIDGTVAAPAVNTLKISYTSEY